MRVKCSLCVSWDGPDPVRGEFMGICIAGRGTVHGDEYHPMCYQPQLPEPDLAERSRGEIAEVRRRLLEMGHEN